MHVAIVGAGALGRVYGVRLAADAHVAVTFVVRPRQLGDGAMRLARIDGDQRTHLLDAPTRATSIPADADVALVCVRSDQLDDALVAQLEAAPNARAVMMTPMLPRTYARLRARLGDRLIAAMPSVVAHAAADGTTRYWLPRPAATLIDEPARADAAVAELQGALGRAGIRAAFELGVHEENPATTIAFFPLALGVDAARSVDALLDDDALLDLTLRASDEAGALAARVGKVATWAGLLMKFVNAYTLKVGVALAKRRAPEAVAYVEEHFGQKVHAQNVAMAEEIAELAREKGAAHDAFDALAERVRARDARGDRGDRG